MADTEVIPLQPRPAGLPAEVEITRADSTPRFTPRELEMIKDRFGRSMTELTQDDTDDKLVVLAFLKLRRQGLQVGFDDLTDVVIVLRGNNSEDPTNAGPTETSPPSVTPGG